MVIILFLLLFIIDFYFLIKSIKTKSNRNWIILFTLSTYSIISVFLVGFYASANTKNLGWDSVGYLAFSVIAFYIYIFMFFFDIIFKWIEVKRQKTIQENINKTSIKKLILVPLFSIFLLTLIILGIDYLISIF